jgi:hypothetical protein
MEQVFENDDFVNLISHHLQDKDYGNLALTRKSVQGELFWKERTENHFDRPIQSQSSNWKRTYMFLTSGDLKDITLKSPLYCDLEDFDIAVELGMDYYVTLTNLEGHTTSNLMAATEANNIPVVERILEFGSSNSMFSEFVEFNETAVTNAIYLNDHTILELFVNYSPEVIKQGQVLDIFKSDKRTFITMLLKYEGLDYDKVLLNTLYSKSSFGLESVLATGTPTISQVEDLLRNQYRIGTGQESKVKLLIRYIGETNPVINEALVEFISDGDHILVQEVLKCNTPTDNNITKALYEAVNTDNHLAVELIVKSHPLVKLNRSFLKKYVLRSKDIIDLIPLIDNGGISEEQLAKAVQFIVQDDLELAANALLYTKSITAEHIDMIHEYLFRKRNMRESIKDREDLNAVFLEAAALGYLDIFESVLNIYNPPVEVLEEALRISVDKGYDLFVRGIVSLGVVESGVLSEVFVNTAERGDFESLRELLKVKGITEDALRKALTYKLDFDTKDMISKYTRKQHIKLRTGLLR